MKRAVHNGSELLFSKRDSAAKRQFYSFGPALITSGGQPSSNFLKFSIKRAASDLYLCMYASLLGHESAGLSTLGGTSSQLIGTWKPKIGSLKYFTFRSFPSSALLSKARVYLMLIRFPTP